MTQNAFFSYFWGRILKKSSHIWNSILKLFILKNFAKKKMPKFGTKNTLFGYFWVKIFQGCCRIWNKHPDTCQIPKFYKNCLKLGPKIPYLVIFGQELFFFFCHIWHQHPQFFLNAKFCEKTKMPKFGTKDALLGVFLG